MENLTDKEIYDIICIAEEMYTGCIEKGLNCGLCSVLNYSFSISQKNIYEAHNFFDIEMYIPIFNKEFFKELEPSENIYWWEESNTEVRYKAFQMMRNYYNGKIDK